MKKNLLKLAAISGLLTFFLEFPFATPEVTNYFNFTDLNLFFLLTLSALSYLFFLFGFIYLGKKTKNTTMIISSSVLILIGIISDLTIYLSETNLGWFMFVEQFIVAALFGVTLGLAGIFHGYSLLRLKKYVGNIAIQTGWVEIIFSFSLLTLVLSPIALLLIIPLYVLEILLLLKANKIRI